MSYMIGIDFGTTNSTLAYIRLNEEKPLIEQFLIPQLAAPHTLVEEPILPSFLYFPSEEELAKQAFALPWDSRKNYCIGIYARERGAEAPNRLVHSAKSWLCHQGIDRRAKLLPLTSVPEQSVPKISPLEACSAILSHLKESWDHKMGAEAPFIQQEIFVTVPASFDPGARQLVQEAAKLAGYPEIILLEEPLAAFYAWLYTHQTEWRKQLKVGEIILIVDVGGGTTDFSTIHVKDQQGELVLERQAVGSHLLLGGDNLDLALAYQVKDKWEEKGQSLDDWQMNGLIHACRREKEKLFSESASKTFEVAVIGRGSKLIGGTVKGKLPKEEVLGALQEGFFPHVRASVQSVSEQQIGLRQAGLPYAADARITCQLAKFLSMTGEGVTGDLNQFVIPAAVLFNGGSMKGGVFREGLVKQLDSWAAEFNKNAVKELPSADYDFAVSRGAAYYALARKGEALRVKAGTSRSYFIGVEDAAPAVPGRPPRIRALCVVPFGMEEGSEQLVEGQEFSLVLGEKATFRFFSHASQRLSEGVEPKAGTMISAWQKELSELHPIEAMMDKGELDGKIVNVRLRSHLTELGVLELWCEAADGRRWKLEFDVRN